MGDSLFPNGIHKLKLIKERKKTKQAVNLDMGDLH